MAVDVPVGMVGGHLTQEVVGRVVVDELVVIVGEEIACIVESAQGQQRVEEVGTAEEEVACVEATHRAARDDEGLVAKVAHLWYQFIDDVVVPPLVQFDATGYLMKKNNVATLEELVEAAKALGINMYACEMAMHVLGLKKEDFIPEVKDVLGVASFLKLSDGGQTLFI